MALMAGLRKKAFAAVLLLAAWSGAAWLIAHHYYLHRAGEVVQEGSQDARDDVRSLAHSVQVRLDVMHGVPRLVAGLASVQAAVSRTAGRGDPARLPYAARKRRWTADPVLSQASAMMESVRAYAGADRVYVLDAHGYCIASSDWDLPGSRVGRDYSARPRFRNARQGAASGEYALDRSSNVPALFFYAPIMVHGRLQGVAVTAVDMPSLLYLISTTEGYITDRNGVIVVASDPALRLHALPGAQVNTLDPGAREALYDAARFPELREVSGEDPDFPALTRYGSDRTPYVVASAPVADHGLTVHVRERLAELLEVRRAQAWLAVLIAALGGIALLGAAFAAFSIRALRTEQRVLAESEARFRGLIEQSLTGIYVTQDDKIVYANPQMCEIVGRPAHEVLGRDSLDFFSGDPAGMQTVRESRARLARGERSVSLVAPYLRPDGKSIQIGIHAAVGLWDGRPAAFVLAADITERRRSEETLAQYVRQLEESMAGTLEAVSNMVEQRDPYTAGHERRVGVIAAAIAAEMGWPPARCKDLERIGLVHDIGKIAVPAEILTKPGKITAIEYELVKIHAERGYQILKNVKFPLPIAEIIRQHHERLDGSGYPQGLKGDAILPEARILAVADVVESMASHRPYRPALGLDAALREIEAHRGTRYDTVVVDALLTLVRNKGYQLPP